MRRDMRRQYTFVTAAMPNAISVNSVYGMVYAVFLVYLISLQHVQIDKANFAFIGTYSRYTGYLHTLGIPTYVYSIVFMVEV